MTFDVQSDSLVDEDDLNVQTKPVFRVDHVVRNTLAERCAKKRVFNRLSTVGLSVKWCLDLLVVCIMRDLEIFGRQIVWRCLRAHNLLIRIWILQGLGIHTVEIQMLVVLLVLMQIGVILFTFPHDCISNNLVVLFTFNFHSFIQSKSRTWWSEILS